MSLQAARGRHISPQDGYRPIRHPPCPALRARLRRSSAATRGSSTPIRWRSVTPGSGSTVLTRQRSANSARIAPARPIAAAWKPQPGSRAKSAAPRSVGSGGELDRYQRLIATWWKGTEDLNGWLVLNGWAVAFRRYSTAYVAAEDTARAAKRGLWAGDFEMPWDWRKAH